MGHRVRMEYGLWCCPDLDVAGARANIHPDHLVDGGGSDNCTTDLLAQARRVYAVGFRLHGADAGHDCHRPRSGRPQVGHGPLQGIHRFRDGHATSFCWRAKVLRQVCVLRGGVARGGVLRGRLARSARTAQHPGARNRSGLQLPANRYARPRVQLAADCLSSALCHCPQMSPCPLVALRWRWPLPLEWLRRLPSRACMWTSQPRRVRRHRYRYIY